jgi:hypothetical protein
VNLRTPLDAATFRGVLLIGSGDYVDMIES